MRELEKLLEEIDDEIEKQRVICRDIDGTSGWQIYEKAMNRTKDIIRKHMNDDNPCGKCSRRRWYMEGYQDALKEPSVSESFLEDCKRTAQKYQRDNDGWIPIYDRLPIPNKEVLVTVKRKGKVFTSTDSMTEKWNFWNYDKENILAWREKELIPEPYHPERNEE